MTSVQKITQLQRMLKSDRAPHASAKPHQEVSVLETRAPSAGHVRPGRGRGFRGAGERALLCHTPAPAPEPRDFQRLRDRVWLLPMSPRPDTEQLHGARSLQFGGAALNSFTGWSRRWPWVMLEVTGVVSLRRACATLAGRICCRCYTECSLGHHLRRGSALSAEV